MMEQYAPKQKDGSQPPHTRTFYDLKAGQSYTLDLDNPLVPCSPSSIQGDWGDPFSASAQMGAELAKQKAIAAGIDTVNGVRTKVLVASSPQGSAKLWIDPRTGLVMRWEATEPKGKPQIVTEVKEFSAASPPASLFEVPASCKKASEEDRGLHLAAVPGGGENGVANAIMPPASDLSCTALLRVVPVGSMTPIPNGYQVAIDRNVDPDHPASYNVGLTADGRAEFGGGGLHEETVAIKDGILRIDNVPKQIHIELCFGKAGCSSALIYRHCTAPESTLVFSVHNRARLADGGEWLWIKAKPAAAQ
jgi:hypothetical protein